METQSTKAQILGILIPSSPWEGVVTSVFPKAINILHPNGFLVSFVEEPSQMSSLSIHVPGCFEGEILSRITPGMKVSFSKGSLVMDGISLELGDAQAWDGCLSINTIENFDFAELRLFKEALLLVGKPGGLLSLFKPGGKPDPFVEKCSEILERAWVEQWQGEVMLLGLSPLVGLGIGLTPSGDDFLAGVLLGEKIVSHFLLAKPEQLEKETGKRYSLQVEREEIFKSLEKTTVAGKTLLFQALNGQFPYFLLKLADQMAQASCLDWAMKAFAETTRHGETSGTDASVGLIWFLNYFKGNSWEFPL